MSPPVHKPNRPFFFGKMVSIVILLLFLTSAGFVFAEDLILDEAPASDSDIVLTDEMILEDVEISPEVLEETRVKNQKEEVPEPELEPEPESEPETEPETESVPEPKLDEKPVSPAQTAQFQDLREDAIVLAIRQARPAVVNIRGEKLLKPTSFDANSESQHVNGMGTGIFIDPRGYIITNFHVVDGIHEIHVTTADAKSYVAKVLARDSETDLAIIKIEPQDGETFQTIHQGHSTDLMTGETVIAVGNAYGYEHTVTRGIVSALHRSVQVNDVQFYEDLIQTDASINPGNSGGPLLNIHGDLIGINVAVRAGAQGIGFAIPVDRAMEVTTGMISEYVAEEKWHGIQFRPLSSSNSGGLWVEGVEPNSPAATIGLRSGDRIVSVDSLPIQTEMDFVRSILETRPGQNLVLKVERNRRFAEVKLALGSVSAPSSRTVKIESANRQVGRQVTPASTVAVPATPAPSSARNVSGEEKVWDTLGLLMTPVPQVTLANQTSSRYRGGMLVQNVQSGSLAERQGIRRGDILLGILRWETLTLENVVFVLEQPEFSAQAQVKFLIARGGRVMSGYFER